jgi:hypothetical protein
MMAIGRPARRPAAPRSDPSAADKCVHPRTIAPTSASMAAGSARRPIAGRHPRSALFDEGHEARRRLTDDLVRDNAGYCSNVGTGSNRAGRPENTYSTSTGVSFLEGARRSRRQHPHLDRSHRRRACRVRRGHFERDGARGISSNDQRLDTALHEHGRTRTRHLRIVSADRVP